MEGGLGRVEEGLDLFGEINRFVGEGETGVDVWDLLAESRLELRRQILGVFQLHFLAAIIESAFQEGRLQIAASVRARSSGSLRFSERASAVSLEGSSVNRLSPVTFSRAW